MTAGEFTLCNVHSSVANVASDNEQANG